YAPVVGAPASGPAVSEVDLRLRAQCVLRIGAARARHVGIPVERQSVAAEEVDVDAGGDEPAFVVPRAGGVAVAQAEDGLDALDAAAAERAEQREPDLRAPEPLAIHQILTEHDLAEDVQAGP